MKRLIAILAGLLLAAVPACGFASNSFLLTGVGGPRTGGGGGGYSGPGDAAGATAAAWYGLRAYSAAAAAAQVQAVRLARSADGEQCDLKVTTAGGLATTVSGCSGVSGGQNATTWCANAGGSCNVAEWYDQTGHAVHEINGSNQPGFSFSCVNSKPCVTFNGSQWLVMAGTYSSAGQPYTIAAVAIRTGGFGSQGDILAGSNGVFFDAQVSGVGKVAAWFGDITDVSEADSAWHSLIWGVNSAAATSTMNVDGTVSSGLSWGSASLSTDYQIGAQNGSTSPLTGSIAEVGVWNSLLGTQGAVCQSAGAYYSITVIC